MLGFGPVFTVLFQRTSNVRRFLLAMAALLALPALPAGAATLERTHVMSDGRGYLFSFHFDGAVAHRQFTLGEPARLVVDVDASTKGEGVANLALDGGLVKRIRYGEHKGGTLRVVIDLEEAVAYAVGTLEGQPEVLRVTLTRAPAGRFVRRELPKVAPPAEEPAREVTAAAPPAPPTMAEETPPVKALKCLELVDRADGCEGVLDEVMEVTDNPYPHDAPPPPAATFEVERPGLKEGPKGQPEGSLGVHRFTKQTRTGKQRTDVGYKTHLGESEVGVSLLRPSLTWEREAGGGDLRMLLRPDEFQLGYQMQWR